jgi:hypothetical protein
MVSLAVAPLACSAFGEDSGTTPSSQDADADSKDDGSTGRDGAGATDSMDEAVIGDASDGAVDAGGAIEPFGPACQFADQNEVEPNGDTVTATPFFRCRLWTDRDR